MDKLYKLFTNYVFLDKSLRFVHGIIFPFLAVWFLGLSEYGAIVLLISIVGFLSVFIHLGLSRPIFVALAGVEKYNRVDSSMLMLQSIILRVITLALLVFLLLIAVSFFKLDYYEVGFIIAGLLARMYMGFDSFMQAAGKVRAYYRVSCISLVISIPLKIFFIWYAPDNVFIIYVFIFEDLMILFGSIFLFFGVYQHSGFCLYELFFLSINFFKNNLHSFYNSVVSSFQANGDRLIVGMVGGDSILAIYSFARMPLNASKALVSALYADNAKKLTQARINKSYTFIRQYFKISLLLVFILSIISIFVYPIFLVSFKDDIVVSRMVMFGISIQMLSLPFWSYFNDLTLSLGEYKNYFYSNVVSYLLAPVFIVFSLFFGVSEIDAVVFGFGFSVLCHFSNIILGKGCKNSGEFFLSAIK